MTKRLMIVDDSPLMRAFVRRTLAIAGFEVETCHEASSGREAIEKLRRALAESCAPPVDLILTDINMPEMDGEGLLRELKSSPSLSRIPVVVVSTDSTQQRVGDLLKLGARDYVRKPFRPEHLAVVLAGIFPGWSLGE